LRKSDETNGHQTNLVKTVLTITATFYILYR